MRTESHERKTISQKFEQVVQIYFKKFEVSSTLIVLMCMQENKMRCDTPPASKCCNPNSNKQISSKLAASDFCLSREAFRAANYTLTKTLLPYFTDTDERKLRLKKFFFLGESKSRLESCREKTKERKKIRSAFFFGLWTGN